MWFRYQTMLSRAMGTRYADIARLQIIHVDAKTSTAITSLGCDPIQRGDLVRPFVVRPAPQFHAVKLDPSASLGQENGDGGNRGCMTIRRSAHRGESYTSTWEAIRACGWETISGCSAIKALAPKPSFTSPIPLSRPTVLGAHPLLTPGIIFRGRCRVRESFSAPDRIPRPSCSPLCGLKSWPAIMWNWNSGHAGSNVARLVVARASACVRSLLQG